MGSVNYGRMSGVQIWELRPRVMWKLTKSTLQYGSMISMRVETEAHHQALTR